MEAHVSHMYGPKYAMCVWWSMRWSVVSVEWSSSCSKAAAMTLPVVRVRAEVAHGGSEVVPVFEKIVAKTAAGALKTPIDILRRRENTTQAHLCGVVYLYGSSHFLGPVLAHF